MFNAAFAPYVSERVYIGTLQLIPLLKAFYGCLYGRRAAVTGTAIEKGESVVAQRKTKKMKRRTAAIVKPAVALALFGMTGRLCP